MSRPCDVLVVGGGAIGTSVAFHLAREGLSVVLLEREGVAAGASGAAAGMLTPLGEFAGDGPLLRFARESGARFPSLCRELHERSGVDPEFVPSGSLRLALDGDEAEALRAVAAGLGGDDVEWIDAAAARAAEPQLASAVCGALWSPGDAHVRSPLLARAYARSAVQLGARIEEGVDVLALEREGDRVVGARSADARWSAGHVVVCTGAWTRGAAPLQRIGLSLPIEPVRGQIVSLSAPDPGLRTILWDRAAYRVPKRDGSVVVGATEERVGFDARVTAAGVAQLTAAAPVSVPALAGSAFLGAWAGLRPAAPDRLPLIGPVPGLPGLLIATGHYRYGVLLSPLTGGWVADMVLGKGLPGEARAFLPERFPGIG